MRISSCLPLTATESRSRVDFLNNGDSSSTLGQLVMICPAFASPAMRAATFTASP